MKFPFIRTLFDHDMIWPQYISSFKKTYLCRNSHCHHFVKNSMYNYKLIARLWNQILIKLLVFFNWQYDDYLFYNEFLESLSNFFFKLNDNYASSFFYMPRYPCHSHTRRENLKVAILIKLILQQPLVFYKWLFIKYFFSMRYSWNSKLIV